MTVSASVNTITYHGDGSTKSFSAPFRVLLESDIKLYLTNRSTNVVTEIVSDYSITPDDGWPTESLTVVYPVTAGAITSDYNLTIVRTVANTQESEFGTNTNDIMPKSIELALDKIVMQVQQLEAKVVRSIKLVIGSDMDAETLSTQVSEDAATAKAEVEIATTKASEASVSAANAKTHEDNAKTHEENTKTSEENAQNSVTQAAEYAQEAKASALNAVSVYSGTETYNFPDMIAYTDGYTYRCIGTNVTGEEPDTSTKWVRITVSTNDFFDIDDNGALMPAENPTYSEDFELDSNGDIMPKEA